MNLSIVYPEWKSIILSLLDIGMPFDPSDPRLVSFLNVECLQGRFERAETSVKGRVNFKAIGHCPKKYSLLGTALHAAVFGGQLEILRYLLDVSVDLCQKGSLAGSIPVKNAQNV